MQRPMTALDGHPMGGSPGMSQRPSLAPIILAATKAEIKNKKNLEENAKVFFLRACTVKLYMVVITGHIHSTSFSSLLNNGLSKIECLSLVCLFSLLIGNTSAYWTHL
jgi:hypothetical protein